MSGVRPHVSVDMCQESHVMCHLLPVTCHKCQQPQPQTLPLLTPQYAQQDVATIRLNWPRGQFSGKYIFKYTANILQYTAICCTILQNTAIYFILVNYTARYCNIRYSTPMIQSLCNPDIILNLKMCAKIIYMYE